MTQTMRSLLDYRVIVVTGKGGTGKTSVAAGLAEAAQRTGRKVLLAETAPHEAIAGYFEPQPAPLGYTGRMLRPNLHAMRIDPNAALAEYLGLQTGLRTLAKRVLRMKMFQQLLEAIPGWRELIILGKVWHLEQKRNQSNQPLYDLVIVDAPSTGHGMTFLDVPRVVHQTVRAGPLSRHAEWVESLVHDHGRTLLLPVTLPEELPVLETRELVERARREIDIEVDRVVVNAMPKPRAKSLTPELEGLPDDLYLESLPPVPVLREMLLHAEHREALAFRERDHVSELCDLPVVDLPFSPSAFTRDDEWSAFVDAVLQRPIWPPGPGHGRDPEDGAFG